MELLRERPRRASELAEASGTTRPAMSRHLRVLRSSGLVGVETLKEDARGRVYRLRADRLLALQAWLDEMRTFWTGQLGAFKAHAERKRRRRR